MADDIQSKVAAFYPTASGALCVRPTKEQISQAREILIEAHRQYVHSVTHGGPEAGAQLDFSGEDLRYAKFAEADLSHATFHKAQFRKADLQECDFHLASLENAKLGRAKVKGVRFPAQRASNPKLG